MIPPNPIPLSATRALRREQETCAHRQNRHVQTDDIGSVPLPVPHMNKDRGTSYTRPVALGSREITSQEYQNQKHFP